MKAADGWLEKLGSNARSRAKTKGHGRVLELPLVEREAEVAAVGWADPLVHEEVGDVDLGHHHIAALDEERDYVQPLHLGVLIVKGVCQAHGERSTPAPCR